MAAEECDNEARNEVEGGVGEAADQEGCEEQGRAGKVGRGRCE